MKIKTRVFDVRSKTALRHVLPGVVLTLKRGGIIIFPTDTVYGIGGNALDESVIKKIYRIKRRKEQKALLINVAQAKHLSEIVKKRPRAARILERAFWPGPLSLVYEASETLPRLLTGKEKKIGARIPSHPVALALLKKSGFPLISTSANLSGQRAPQTAEKLLRIFSGKVDVILDAGPCPLNKPSTVADVTVNPPAILREGALSRETIRKALKSRR